MTIIGRGTLRENICTRTLETSVLKFLLVHGTSLRTEGAPRALRRLPASPPHALPSRGDRAPSHPVPAAPRHSLLGRTPHRGPRLPTGRRLPAIPRRGSGRAGRRGPRLPRRLLGTAHARPRSRLGHGPPTHGASRHRRRRHRGSASSERSGAPPVGGARPWPPPLSFPPASEGEQGASASVTARRPAASDPQRGGAARGGGASRDAVPAHAPAQTEPPARPSGVVTAHAPLPGVSVPPGFAVLSPCPLIFNVFPPLTPAGHVRGGKGLRAQRDTSSVRRRRRTGPGCEGACSVTLGFQPGFPQPQSEEMWASRVVCGLHGLPRGTVHRDPPASVEGFDLKCGVSQACRPRAVSWSLPSVGRAGRAGSPGQLSKHSSVCSWTVFFQIEILISEEQGQRENINRLK